MIDEPDSHLHPDAQGRLIREIAKAADEHECQVIITTHSPNVMRSLPDEASVIWMRQGEVVEDAASARLKMGWGILDKDLVLLTEDKNTEMLRLLLSQWPELERRIAIMPLGGSGNIPKGGFVENLSTLFGNVPILIHRDGDMMLENEKDLWREKMSLKERHIWITKGADIESYFADPTYCAKVLGKMEADVKTKIFDKLTASHEDADFSKKRADACSLYPGGKGTPVDEDAFNELRANGLGHVRKKSVRAVRAKIQEVYKGGSEGSIGKKIPEGMKLATDLKSAIETALTPEIEAMPT